MAKKTPHMVPKGGRFYFRMRVPAELVAHVGKSEVSQALGDVTKPQAEVAARQLASQWAEHFLNERHRLGLVANPPAQAPAANIPRREPSLPEVRALAQLAAHSMLANDLESRVEGTQTGAIELPAFGPGLPLDESLQAAIAGRDMTGIQMQVQDWLGAYGLDLPAVETDARRALMTWAVEMAKARKGSKLRDAGEPVETPEPPTLPASLQPVADLPAGKKDAAHLKLRDVLDLWTNDERTRPPKTIQKAAQAVSHFEALTDNPSLGTLNKAMGAEFRRALMSSRTAAGLPISDKTASDRLSWVQILLNFEASRYDRIASNPWKGLTIKVKKSATREEWKDAEACKLFASASEWWPVECDVKDKIERIEVLANFFRKCGEEDALGFQLLDERSLTVCVIPSLKELVERIELSGDVDPRVVPKCPVPCDHVPVRSWPLFRAREVMREVMASLTQEQQS